MVSRLGLCFGLGGSSGRGNVPHSLRNELIVQQRMKLVCDFPGLCFESLQFFSETVDWPTGRDSVSESLGRRQSRSNLERVC